jgi:hypothetical protein
MNKKITCFFPYGVAADAAETVKELKNSTAVERIFALTGKNSGAILPDGCESLSAGSLQQTQTLKALVSRIHTPYTLFCTQSSPLRLGAYALDRMSDVIALTGAGLLYSDYYKTEESSLKACPLIDYQDGSLRDDFDFGPLLLYKSSALTEAVNAMDRDYCRAALYDLRLKISRTSRLFHLPEFLYTERKTDSRKSGEKQFDYLDPENRQAQIEMEQACTQHLKNINAWLKPEFTPVEFSAGTFPVEASVIIPVRNREKTIEDAVRSVLQQKTDFPFNLIVADNHSSDGTTAILRKIALTDNRLIHLIPKPENLGIGGCWNEAILNPHCGKFAVQLDSDDLYSHQTVLQTIVNAFYEQKCAMITGSYRMVNFRLEEIPPGIIDHREWTPENGRNNALRINGLGAPRAFYTPVLRNIKFPDTCYGEDYAAGLAISRNYRIGRIYEPLYLCRRWDDNSDASPDINTANRHNFYKDRIRTIELLARQQMNGNKTGK